MDGSDPWVGHTKCGFYLKPTAPQTQASEASDPNSIPESIDYPWLVPTNSDSYLDSLLARSVHALELSNTLSQSSLATKSSMTAVLSTESPGRRSGTGWIVCLVSRPRWTMVLALVMRGVHRSLLSNRLVGISPPAVLAKGWGNAGGAKVLTGSPHPNRGRPAQLLKYSSSHPHHAH